MSIYLVTLRWWLKEDKNPRKLRQTTLAFIVCKLPYKSNPGRILSLICFVPRIWKSYWSQRNSPKYTYHKGVIVLCPLDSSDMFPFIHSNFYIQNINKYIECFDMTSRWPYWCPKTMKRRPCWCPKQIFWELNFFLMHTLSFVPINLHRCWSREWKHSILCILC